jgi:F-type H+-transporting ATPase subunit b
MALPRPRILLLLMLGAALAGAPLLTAHHAQKAAKSQAQAPATGEPAPPAGHAGSPQEPAVAEASKEAGHAEPFKLWGKWVIPGWVVELLRWSNFVILFGILGYLLRKPMGRFFSDRGREILEGIARGRRAREEAAARLRDIEARLAGLEAEIARLRQAAGTEAQADHDRLRARAQAEAEKIRAMAEHEIAWLAKQARSEIKDYAAALAVELAEQRIRARLTPERQDALLRRYAEQVGSARQ